LTFPDNITGIYGSVLISKRRK